MPEDCENWMEYKMSNVKLRMKTDARPHLNLKGDYMKTLNKYHSQLSPTSRKRRMEIIEIDKMNPSIVVKEMPSRSVGTIPQTIMIEPPKKFTKVQLPSVPSNQITAGNLKNQQKAKKILFRNNNEELCIIGVEKEVTECKKKIESANQTEPTKQTEPIDETKPRKQKENEHTDIVKEPQLIVCEETGLYKNKEGEYFNAALEAINENEVNAEKKKAKIRGENLFEISDTCSVSENFICEETGLFRNSKGEYFTEFGKPLDVQEVEADKVKAKIRGENLFQITNICTVPEETMENVEEVPDKATSSLETSIAAPSPLQKLQNLVSSTESISCGDKSSNNHEVPEGLIDIKEEPLEMNIEEGRVEFNYVPEDDEETLTASESASYQSLEGLLDSLDTYETNQYIDVPEFVQINHFTMKDLENLKMQQQGLHDETQSSQNAFTSVPYREQINDINLKRLLADNSSQDPQVNLNQNMSEKVAFGADLFARSEEMYKLDKITNRFPILPLPELPNDNIINNLYRSWSVNYPKKLKLPPIVKKSAQKPRRRKVKIIAVNENETGKNSKANTSYPNREICVLFTNYTYDGVYINDHDYLLTPYKRNKILLKENGQSFCMCFICGYKHRLEEHVIHMNLHNPTCLICNVNLGTGYMLNLHVRTHSRPCKICTDLVPYSEISNHEKKHEEKELEYSENDKGRNRKKKNDKDQKSVYYPLPCEDYGISKSPRLRSSSHVSSNEVDGMQTVNENNEKSDKTDVNNTDTENVGTKNVEENNIETNNVETNNVETNNVETNNVETNNVETNNVEKNNVEANNVETNNVEKNNVEANNADTNNVEKNNVEANNEKTTYSETNSNTVEAEVNSSLIKSAECSEMEDIKAEANSTNYNDAKNIEMNENESTEPKKLYSKRKRKIILSKEECDLEQKLLKICEKSKELAEKRVLRSSFVIKEVLSGHKCSYLNCQLTKRIDPALRMYRFPVKDTARCQKWIKNSGNPDFADLSPKDLIKKFICMKHFSEETQEFRKLPSDAVPFPYTTCDGSGGEKEHFEDIVPEFNVSSVVRSYVPVRGDSSTQPSCSHTA